MRAPIPIGELDGPFRYVYVAISHVIGITLPDGSPDPQPVADLSDVGAEAYLTNNWDKEYFHIDRSNAYAALLLTGYRGTGRYPRLSGKWHDFLRWVFGREWVYIRNLEREANQTRQKRRKVHSGSGCCLVYKAQGELVEPPNLTYMYKIGQVGCSLDGVDVSIYRNHHRDYLHSIATAVSIALADTSGSPETQLFGDTLYLMGRDGLVIYCRTSQAGTPTVTTTTTAPEELRDTVSQYSSALIQDRKIGNPASLFVVSQYKSNDNLRAFVSAWAALEMLINYLAKKLHGEWKELNESETPKLPNLDEIISGENVTRSGIVKKFFSAACVLNLQEAEADTKSFAKLDRIRNDYYHKVEVHDTDLPTANVQTLFRKYLRIFISSRASMHPSRLRE